MTYTPASCTPFCLENAMALPAVARHIGRELRTQYVLGYRPQDMPKDGKWHKIRLKINDVFRH